MLRIIFTNPKHMPKIQARCMDDCKALWIIQYVCKSLKHAFSVYIWYFG